jgi:type IV pilus assembly protein PilQ
MRALSIVMVVVMASPAHADRDLCAPGTRFRGAPVDLDVQNAPLHDVYRLLSEVGRVNIVLPDAVQGKVTLRLRRVPWDQVACTVAAVHALAIHVDGNVLLITKR